jgi:uncharacterized protein with PIN domain
MENKHMDNIEIAYDTTDHFTFICPICGNDCKVINSKTVKGQLIDNKGTKDSCTFMTIECPVCEKVGQRKIYWNGYKHERSKMGRTNWKAAALTLLKIRSILE